MMQIVRSTAIFLALFGWAFGEDRKSSYEVSEVYEGLRQQALNVKSEEAGSFSGKPVWAVLMESGHSQAAVTLVAVGDSGSSLYFSSGGGIIGAAGLENVPVASSDFVKLAGTCLHDMKKTEEFPIVKPDYTTFYVLTDKGVFTYTAKTDDLGENRDKLSKLFHQGHHLISQIRIATERREAEKNKKPN
ncbi:hypothetical protein [Planctomicrobium piriforme]|uniref:Uncharacterized protein n=1 Tax=Planctomicrobium piriforme TaxID=1576369 RepID=A0A1I3PRI0_9PLAN|nr:hypothetical protein [Planctomicrobium piriforme]SFJ23980.1 hypothetical protein SAMN05421753_1177 [Planctomicrobium piriforme]